MMAQKKIYFVPLLGLLVFSGCLPMPAEPKPGPDKQGLGVIYGTMLGAGSGAVTGFEVAAASGPGAWVGAGFGAIYGMISGMGLDALEEDQLRRLSEEQAMREQAYAQEVLAEHYARRLELHPDRDIYPADVFFDSDGVTLRDDAALVIRELARLSHQRMPWSRLVITAYVTSQDEDSTYASYLTERRAEAIALNLVRSGIAPQRLATRAVTLAEPVLVDPYDQPDRYRQAIEITPIDR